MGKQDDFFKEIIQKIFRISWQRSCKIEKKELSM